MIDLISKRDIKVLLKNGRIDTGEIVLILTNHKNSKKLLAEEAAVEMATLKQTLGDLEKMRGEME